MFINSSGIVYNIVIVQNSIWYEEKIVTIDHTTVCTELDFAVFLHVKALFRFFGIGGPEVLPILP